MTIRYLQRVGPYQPGEVAGAGSAQRTEEELVADGAAEWHEPEDAQERDVDHLTADTTSASKSDPEVREQLSQQALKDAVEDLPWTGEGDIRGLASRVEDEVGDDGPDGRAREDYEAYLLDHPEVARQLMEG